MLRLLVYCRMLRHITRIGHISCHVDRFPVRGGGLRAAWSCLSLFFPSPITVYFAACTVPSMSPRRALQRRGPRFTRNSHAFFVCLFLFCRRPFFLLLFFILSLHHRPAAALNPCALYLLCDMMLPFSPNAQRRAGIMVKGKRRMARMFGASACFLRRQPHSVILTHP